MQVTRPDQWKGSDLRSRTEVVQYLRQHGGEVTDQTGLVVGIMRQELGKGRALSQLLSDMEADGMLEREVRGRRTFRITLKDDWDLVPSTISVLPDPPAMPSGEGVDAVAVAEALLAITLKRMSSPPPPKADPRQTERLADLELELKHAVADCREAERQRDEALEQVRILTHNLEVVQRQASRRPAGPTIEQMLSEEDLAALAQLQRELPATPTSKPR